MKIPTEDFSSVTMVISDTYGDDVDVAMGAIDMEDDKVADMVLKM